MRKLKLFIERFPIAGGFTIARGSKSEAVVVVAELFENGVSGRGECVPYGRYNETPDSVIKQIENVKEELEQNCTRHQLQTLLPAGAARNAVDCALWDLEAKQSNRRAYEIAGLTKLDNVETAFTISLGPVEKMFEAAKNEAQRPLLKIKLGSVDGDIDRIFAVREAAPNSKLIADANEGWTKENIKSHIIACKQAKYSLIEQPLPSTDDSCLGEIDRLVPVCADESVHGLSSLDRLKGLYDFVNIKLDKTGGLTEALLLQRAAREKGFGIMVGCMVSTSLAMAPAMLIAQNAEFVDLDGPLLLSRDRSGGLRFEGSTIFAPEKELWG